MKIITKEGEIKTLSPLLRPKEKKKIDFEFQQLGVEMSEKFGKKHWFLFYRYPLPKIREAWKICQNKRIFALPYIIGIIKKIK